MLIRTHQWGFAWQDGRLTRPRWRAYALASCGSAALAGLLTLGPFPVDMVGAGERAGNTSPPSVALLAFATAQAGLVLAAEPAASRLPLARPRLWRRVTRLNATVMTVYLWHMVPALVIVAAFYPAGVLPQPAVGSGQWWELHPAWFALLTLVLVPLVMAVMRAERPMLRLPAGLGPAGVLVACTADAQHRRCHDRPGQARDRRIRAGRPAAATRPCRLRGRGRRNVADRPRSATGCPAWGDSPEGAVRPAQGRLKHGRNRHGARNSRPAGRGTLATGGPESSAVR